MNIIEKINNKFKSKNKILLDSHIELEIFEYNDSSFINYYINDNNFELVEFNIKIIKLDGDIEYKSKFIIIDDNNIYDSYYLFEYNNYLDTKFSIKDFYKSESKYFIPLYWYYKYYHIIDISKLFDMDYQDYDCFILPTIYEHHFSKNLVKDPELYDKIINQNSLFDNKINTNITFNNIKYKYNNFINDEKIKNIYVLFIIHMKAKCVINTFNDAKKYIQQYYLMSNNNNLLNDIVLTVIYNRILYIKNFYNSI